MRILIHSNAPWVGTGYGQQTALFAPRIRDLGHEVAISAFYGVSGTEMSWRDIPVFPAGARPDGYGIDMIEHFYQKFNADIVIILADAWVGHARATELGRLNVANWIPIDAEPLSRRDYNYLLSTGARPIAMSQFGKRMLNDAGMQCEYVPHGIDLSVFRPYEDAIDRDEMRASLGCTPDTFIIGMNAANRDMHRKGFFEQFSAFAAFHEQVPDSYLYVHTLVDHPRGLDIASLARSCGIDGAVLYPDQGPLAAGEINAVSLVKNFYHLLDLYSGCSLGEGFGIPLLEAQACGVPVVATDASAMTELVAPKSGLLVSGDPLWVEGHQARWIKPSIDGIVKAYRVMHGAWQKDRMVWKRLAADEFVQAYDADRVTEEYWAPALKALESR